MCAAVHRCFLNFPWAGSVMSFISPPGENGGLAPNFHMPVSNPRVRPEIRCLSPFFTLQIVFCGENELVDPEYDSAGDPYVASRAAESPPGKVVYLRQAKAPRSAVPIHASAE
jgi:hypothetical protein